MNELMITCSVSDWFSAQYLLELVYNNASYWLVFLFMVIESSFLPFPSEVVIPPAAYVAVQRGDLNIFMIIVAATAGAVVGALINYILAMTLGRPIVYAFANSRFGHACLIDQEKVENAEQYFDRHGAVSTFIGRLIPAVRQLISIPAGLAKMNMVTFLVFTALGAAVWNCILAALGYWLGKTVPYAQLYESVEKYNHYLTLAGFGLLLLCVLFIAWKFFRGRSKAKKD